MAEWQKSLHNKLPFKESLISFTRATLINHSELIQMEIWQKNMFS